MCLLTVKDQGSVVAILVNDHLIAVEYNARRVTQRIGVRIRIRSVVLIQIIARRVRARGLTQKNIGIDAIGRGKGVP